MNQTEISTITVVSLTIFSVCCSACAFTMLTGFILSALGKYRIGSKLIRFGAVFGVIAFSSAIVARGAHWPVILILLVTVVVFIILKRKGKLKISTCPHCNEQITPEEKWRLYKLFGLRNPITCSHCGTVIVLSKWPSRLMNVSCFLLFTVIAFKFLKVELGFWSDVMIYVIWLTLVIGFFTMKLEISD